MENDWKKELRVYLNGYRSCTDIYIEINAQEIEEFISTLMLEEREDFRKKAEESVEKSRTVLTSHMGKNQELDNVLLAAVREIK